MKRRSSSRRQGSVATEMALVLPIVFVFFFGLWEWSRVEMIRHVTETAVFASARHGTLPGATEAEMEAMAEEVFARYFIYQAQTIATLDTNTDESTVEVVVPLNDNLWIAGNFFKDVEIAAEMTFKK